MSSVHRKTDRYFGKFRNQRPTIFMLFHIYKYRRFRKSHQKSEPGVGMPTEWQHSKVSLRNACQKINTSKTPKMNEMLYLFFWLSGIIGQQFLFYFSSTSIADSENQINKGHWKLECQQNDNIPRPVCETSLKPEKLKIRWKSTKCYIHFHNFLESSANNFYVISHLQVSPIPKITSKSEPELGMPAEWQHSKVSQRNVCQNIKTSKTQKTNEMLYLFLWIFGIIGQKFLCYFTSTSVADSENKIKKVNRDLECQQNDNIPRSVCETPVKK